MANLILPPAWRIPEREVTPEPVYRNRRAFLKQLGVVGGGALSAAMIGCGDSGPSGNASKGGGNTGQVQVAAADSSVPSASDASGYPHPRNPDYDPGWTLTAEEAATSYNNFYEFTTSKTRVKELVGDFVISPWSIQVGGLVEEPLTLHLEDLLSLAPLEERVYRFRCVEAWAMVVPWTGYPLSKLIERCKPKSEAKYVYFETFNDPVQMPGIQKQRFYPWPYNEGLTMEEAMHPLTLVGTGIYGKPMPKQNGAPIRLVVPWKYGYKSIKSIVRMDFTATQPKTFWSSLSPEEYPFESNVDPGVPHPRWSQAAERMIDTGLRVPTQKYNGYGDQVARLYGG